MELTFMNKKRIIITAIIFFSFNAHPAYSQTPKPLPSDVAQFIDQYYALQSEGDYVPMYRDLSTNRFTASDSFANFKKALERIKDECGPVEDRELTFVINDAYHRDQDYVFFRMQFDVKRQQCQTVERMVVFKRNGSWEVDGYAIAKDQQALLAQGNLYNFESANVSAKKIGLEELSKIKGLKDSKTEYLNNNWKQTMEEYRRKQLKFLETAIQGDFQQAKAMMDEDFFSPYRNIIDDVLANVISKETAVEIFSGIKSAREDNIEEGVQILQKVLELEPSYVETYVYLAPLLGTAMEDVESGIKIAEQGLQYHPNEVRLMILLEHFYRSLGEIEKADQYFESVKAINPFFLGLKKTDPDEDGMVRTRYPNGQVALEIRIEDEMPNGPFKVYYEEGAIMSEGQYLNGKQDGIIKVYSPKGQLIKKLIYQEGKEIEAQHFNEDGQVDYEKSVVHGNK